MPENRAAHHVDWHDTTPIETRVERLRGGLHGLASTVVGLESRLEGEMLPMLKEIAKRLDEGSGVAKAARHPIVVAIVVGLLGVVGHALVSRGGLP